MRRAQAASAPARDFTAASRLGRAMPQRISAAPATPCSPRLSSRKITPSRPALSGLSAQNMPARSAVVPRWATGCNVKLARIPITVDTEELVVRGCVRTSGKADPDDAKLVIVRSTKYLDEVYMSRAAVAAARQDSIEVIGDYFDVEFDENGRMKLFE